MTWDVGGEGVVAAADRDSVTSRVMHFIQNMDGKYIQIRLEKALERELRESEELMDQLYAPHVMCEMARRKGRIEVLRALADGALGLNQE